MTALKALEEDQLIKTDTDWLAPSAPSDHQMPPAITNDDRMPCICPSSRLPAPDDGRGAPLGALLLLLLRARDSLTSGLLTTSAPPLK